MNNLENEIAVLTCKVVEHLAYGKKQWVTLLLPNNNKVTLRVKDCGWNFLGQSQRC